MFYGHVPGLKKLVADMKSCDGKWKEFRRLTEIDPWDKSERTEVAVLLFGPKGTVQFKVWSTSYAGPDTYLAVDKGYHSPRPLWDGQEIVENHCRYLEGLPCYYDGSGLGADLLDKKYRLEGLDAFWAEMEEFYRYQFELRQLGLVEE